MPSSTYDHVMIIMTSSYEWSGGTRVRASGNIHMMIIIWAYNHHHHSGGARVRASGHIQTRSAPWRGSQGTRGWSISWCSQKNLDSNEVVLETLDPKDVVLPKSMKCDQKLLWRIFSLAECKCIILPFNMLMPERKFEIVLVKTFCVWHRTQTCHRSRKSLQPPLKLDSLCGIRDIAL